MEGRERERRGSDYISNTLTLASYWLIRNVTVLRFWCSWCAKSPLKQFAKLFPLICIVQYLKHSRSISFLTWCFTHWLVGDSGQPMSVRRQFQHTDASVVYARRSALLDLPDLTYNIKNVRISTVSNISSGTSLNFYSKTSHHNDKTVLF